MDTNAHQDGMIAKYVVSKGAPDTLKITSERLAKFYARSIDPKEFEMLAKNEKDSVSKGGYSRRGRMCARGDLRNAIIAKRVLVDGKAYTAKRVEETWPEYEIVLEVEGLDNNGAHP